MTFVTNNTLFLFLRLFKFTERLPRKLLNGNNDLIDWNLILASTKLPSKYAKPLYLVTINFWDFQEIRISWKSPIQLKQFVSQLYNMTSITDNEEQNILVSIFSRHAKKQRRISNSANMEDGAFCKNSCWLNTLTILAKSSLLDVWQGSE